MSSSTSLTCREFVELVTDYFEGVLPAAERARFEGHIGCCDWCTSYMGQMRETLVVVGHIDPEGLDPRVEDEFLAVFREWKAGGGG
ncbi:MAG TPA: zf-HC2 domain-containing protein [Baekduia sp.]